MKKIGVAWLIVVFAVGALMGAFGGAFFVTWKVLRFEADAITHAVAESTFSLLPFVVALNKDDSEERLNLFESAARTQLTVGIVTLHANLPLLSDEKRKHMTGILYSIANKRDRLKIGRFDDPPQDHIEKILAIYAE